ncbi:metallothionein-like protein 4B [Mangifera indica]|uniref:metallothionein-like protein 4B n=1 Tax=Mangifera indica TaxID=29780 RepID=UPI001CFC23D4|nr:metallothionein-like protein 4B [Mangifera indica]
MCTCLQSEIKLLIVADVRGSAVVCNDRCGCPSPCPGGLACSCTGKEGNECEHNRCLCGEHCGCNPCSRSKTEVLGTEKAFCKCGTGSACPACAA